MKTLLSALAISAVGLAGAALAQDEPFKNEIKARQGIMAYRGLQLGALGAMAKGEVPYDAAAAQKAADNLMASITLDGSMLWPKGSDNTANPASTALPAMWEEGSGIGDKAKAMVEAATALQAAAGTDVEAMKAAMGPVGEACMACHKAFRVSN